jgi:hypothetical protein
MGRSAWGLLLLAAGSGCGGNVEKHSAIPAPTAGAGAGGSVGKAGASGSEPSEGGRDRGGTGSTNGGSVGTLGSAGEPAVGGEGGATVSGPCDDVVPWCVPGESVCHPLLGVTTSCSECGAPLPNPDGSPCVRLLASDKESNGICVVRGETALECWPHWGDPWLGSVPSGTLQVFPPDDFASLLQSDPLALCTRSAASISCLPETCAKVAVGDHGVCGICKGQLYCDGQIRQPDAQPSPLLDLSITDDTVSLLTSEGVSMLMRPLLAPTFARGKPARLLVDHQDAGCVVSDHDELSCFDTSVKSFEASPWQGPFRKLVPATLPRACVLRDDRRLRCGNVLSDLEPKPFELERVIDITASSSLVCGLSIGGHVKCWDGMDLPVQLPNGW